MNLRDIVCKNQTVRDSDSHQIRCFPDILKETIHRLKKEINFFWQKFIFVEFWDHKIQKMDFKLLKTDISNQFFLLIGQSFVSLYTFL